MEFKTQKQVDDYINSLGVFINQDELCMKTDSDNYIVIDDKKAKIISYIDKNTSPFSEVRVTFPVIDFKIFDDYRIRENTIERNHKLLDEINGAKKFLKNGWRLIHLKKPYFENRDSVKYVIYDVKKKLYQPLKTDFFDEKDFKNAYDVGSIVILKNIGKETFENQYIDAYRMELKKWEKIPIYDIGELNE